MNRGPMRKFNVVDGMALVAATAAGFAVFRSSIGVLILEDYVLETGSEWHFESKGEQAAVWFLVLWPLVAAWTAAVFWMRLRRPRPVRRRLFRQPGAIACSSSLLALCLCLLILPAWRIRSPDWLYMNAIFNLLCVCPAFCGVAVVTSWTTAVLVGAWAPESSWIDRLGRGLGFVWIAQAPFSFWFGLGSS